MDDALKATKTWRAVFKEGWECAECAHKKTIVMCPEGWPIDDMTNAPIPQRMCMAGSALNCPAVQTIIREV